MRSTAFCVLALLCFAKFCDGRFLNLAFVNTKHVIRDSETVKNDWEYLENLLKTTMSDATKKLLLLMMDNALNLNLSSSCMKEGTQVLVGIRNLKPWAMRFLDSSAKGIDGMITGTTVSFGAYDECLDTVAINQRSGKHKGEVMFTGKYCLLYISPHLPEWKAYKYGEIMEELKGIYERDTILSKAAENARFLYMSSVQLGICIPSGCSVEDVNQLFEKVGNYTRLYMGVKKCEVKEDPKYTPIMIFVICIYSFTGLLVLLGTAVDLFYRYFTIERRGAFVYVLLAFSIVSNFRKLVDTSTSPKKFRCLHGMRFLTMSWVIIAHTGIIMFVHVIHGRDYPLEKIDDNFAAQVIQNAYVAVDTFFFMGALLVCYTGTKAVLMEGRNFSVAMYLLHRIVRLIPGLAFVILYTFIIKLGISGPLTDNLSDVTQSCERNWWATLLFIQNFYDTDEPCLVHSWYLAVDMQLYIASLIFLWPLFKLRMRKTALGIAIVLLLCSMAGSAVYPFKIKYPPNGFGKRFDPLDDLYFFSEINSKPYMHVVSYVVGALTGYFLAMNSDLKISKGVLVTGWSCAIISGMSVVYGKYEWLNGRDPGFWAAVLYSSFHTLAWTMSLAWMVVCCANGYGGVVNYILSWKLWIPLGRLTYMAYLVHMLVVITLTSTFRTTVDPYPHIMVWFFFGHLMASYGVAFAGSMLVESPFLALEKRFLRPREKKMPSQIEINSVATLDIKRLSKETATHPANRQESCNDAETKTSL